MCADKYSHQMHGLPFILESTPSFANDPTQGHIISGLSIGDDEGPEYPYFPQEGFC